MVCEPEHSRYLCVYLDLLKISNLNQVDSTEFELESYKILQASPEHLKEREDGMEEEGKEEKRRKKQHRV